VELAAPWSAETATVGVMMTRASVIGGGEEGGGASDGELLNSRIL
jgi:hypothetical protein